jgi:hypothetical protein
MGSRSEEWYFHTVQRGFIFVFRNLRIEVPENFVAVCQARADGSNAFGVETLGA